MEKIKELIMGLPWDKIWEAFKTAARNLALAIIPILIAYFETLPYQWAGVLYLLLVGFDNFLHQLWKGDAKKPSGLIPF